MQQFASQQQAGTEASDPNFTGKLDISAFQGAFNTNNPQFDLNGDGTVNFNDFQQAQTRGLFSGTPTGVSTQQPAQP